MDVTFESSDVILEDGPFPFEREDRPRSRTWPILPPPIETIHEHECDAEIAEPPTTIIEEVEEPTNETQKTESTPRKNSRKNAWGNLSYADLITRAIQSSPEQRLTLSQIYEWMVRNIPYFKDKGDSTSSAGWKNSIRHNLSLHSRFMRVQNDNNGKSSYWVINPDAKPGKSSRRSRSGSVDGQPKGDGKRRRNNKKLNQSTDDISALSPNAMKFKQNLSYDNLFNIASPCSSTDSLSNIEDFHNELGYPPYIGESFARPRSTSNVSQQSSVNGRCTPVQIDIDEDLKRLEENQMSYGNGSAEETANLVETMTIDANGVSSINLDESTKFMKQDQKYNMANDSFLNIRRPKSDSFGSGDSGYESPACFSPQQQQQQQRPLNKLPSPKLVPNKPPPPYINGQLNPNIQQQSQMNSFYQQQQQQQQMKQQQRATYAAAPRLKHPPIQQASQNSFTPVYNQPKQQLMRGYPGIPTNPQMHQYNPYMQKNLHPNINIKVNNVNQYHQPQMLSQQQQIQQQRTQLGMSYNNDIPSDLSQVQLYDFDDPQQLANDLDAIIKDDLLTLNNNSSVTSSTPHNGYPNYPVTGQSWVS